jgi:hypothetical protein
VTLLWARLAHIFQCLYGYEGWPISSSVSKRVEFGSTGADHAAI